MKLEEYGAGSGLKVIRWQPPSPSRRPAASSRRIGTNSGLASGVMDQTMLGTSLYRCASHFAHARAFSRRDALAVALMVEGHRDDQVVLAGDLEHGVHVLEIGLVGRQRVVVDPGLLPVHVGLGAVAHAHQHDLGKDKPSVRRLLQNRPGVLQLVLPEELPLRGAQPEDGSALAGPRSTARCR